MSKYTTEVRFICESEAGLKKQSGGYSEIDGVITIARSKIFSFNYPIFDEAYKPILEKKILKHYYTREIGEETYGLWKLRLDTKMNEIMPYYNQLYKSELLEFNPLYNYSMTRDHKTTFDSERNTKATNTDDGYSTDLFSDTPQGSLTGVLNETYLTNARKVDNENTTEHEGEDKFGSTEEYLEHVNGYTGKDASSLLLKYRQTFLNIDMMVIKDLEELFFSLW